MTTEDIDAPVRGGGSVVPTVPASGPGGGERVTLLDTRIVVAISDSVLRHGMLTLLRELPLRCLDSFPMLREADLAEVRAGPSRRVVIVAGSESDAIPWTDIPPEAKILVLLAEPSGVASLRGSVRADGFLLQAELNVHTLTDALCSVLADQFPIPPEVARQLVTEGPAQRSAHLRAASLTERQHETLRLLSEGLTNREISRRLRISEHGAKRLVATVLTKLGCANRAGAVAIAIREGLLP
ncbi:response regulator transcription factor [Streptomonospora sp. PA3]|uniref:helix-turn-helix transcriptional regulator n=1 Tax=Streptomonospora sp. PA3 TaxID=2607326 RepID=UPI0016423FD6|nr:response regulator transcription factor [Streptomonospora sp. PA3]